MSNLELEEVEKPETTDLTVKEYCTRNNLSRNSYFYWLRQLRQEATDSLDPEVPSFYTKDYVGAGISISS